MPESKLSRTFKDSNVWDSRFGLPTRPRHNNPHIYLAYFLLCDLIGVNKLYDYEIERIRSAYIDFFNRCKTKNETFNRWPDGSGGRISHDEILGAAFSLWYFGDVDEAERIYLGLLRSDGVANQAGDKDDLLGESRFDVFRIIYLRPMLQFYSGYSLSLRSELMIALHLVFQLIRNDHGAGGYLRTLLIVSSLRHREYRLLNAVFFFYRIIMNRRGKTPKKLSEQYFGLEEPYHIFMPGSW